MARSVGYTVSRVSTTCILVSTLAEVKMALYLISVPGVEKGTSVLFAAGVQLPPPSWESSIRTGAPLSVSDHTAFAEMMFRGAAYFAEVYVPEKAFWR